MPAPGVTGAIVADNVTGCPNTNPVGTVDAIAAVTAAASTVSVEAVLVLVA